MTNCNFINYTELIGETVSVYIFEVADDEYEVKIYIVKMVHPK